MKYKLLCVDIDGTLASDDKSISQRNIEALKRASQIGIKIALTSGRAPSSLYQIFKTIDAAPLIICLNGACIEIDGKIIKKHTLSKDQIEKALEIIISNQVLAAFNTTTFSIRNSEVSNKWKNQLKKMGIKPDFVIAKDEIEYKKMILENEIVKISILEPNLEKYQQIRSLFNNTNLFTIAKSDHDYIDITDINVNKATAVVMLAKYLNIDISEVICIGDNENDREMLQIAGLSIAMKNASEEIKKIATYVSDNDNNHDGVATVIEKYILNNK
ncbi:HAD family hydrolase [Thomasclavelia sp.]|uniref:HAD family hydrolase n=1 Tax=Thomasclavelia sp. TaxID=3025757 RepID=UPI0025E23AAB|nr:HAD family hydrolase [Thomasclavelia sp.]